MILSSLRSSAGLAAVLATLLVAEAAHAGASRPPFSHEAAGHLTFTSPQANPLALSPDGTLLYVASTTSNRVDVINAATNTFLKQVPVGIEPVSIAVKPPPSGGGAWGGEVWVANHVSDTISVIDGRATSASFGQVIETIQDLDANNATRLDEPVGIAFTEDGAKAYIALSSRNQIAVIDTATYAVVNFLNFRAQEPRAMAVRGSRLYVAAFESGNKTELSACALSGSAPQCTIFLQQLVQFATNPNLPGQTKHIVVDPDVPDRDLFVFNTSNDQELKVTSSVGTLLYGLVVDSAGKVFVTQTDARNDVNGMDMIGGQPSNLSHLGNRMFTNEVAILNCGGGGSSCSISNIIDLDTGFPNPGLALATPYGIALSGDNSTLVGTASGTNRIFTMNSSGTILARLPVGAIPRGVALRSDPGTGAPLTAYVLNTLDNTVSVVNVSNPSAPFVVATVPVGSDPTPAAVRRGAIAFNNALASSSGTFSCASCHPDGNTDQVLWRIGGECSLNGCVEGQDEIRSTMPVRGLRDTLPLHWDGTLGDPFGGPDGSTGIGGSVPPPPGCSTANPAGCFRHLVDASFSGVMCDQSNCPNGPSGKAGLLTNQERDDMAAFLESVSYPPARSRRMNDSLSASAVAGFEDFFMDRGGNAANPDTCADSNAGCHELPLGVATNSETLQAFDAPTMRGMTDRFLQFSLGITNAEELLVFANAGLPTFGISPLEPAIRWDPNQGFREVTTFGAAFAIFQPVYNVRPINIFQMFEEASTGHSGALGRQVTLNTRTATLAATTTALNALEAADLRGVVNLRGNGLRMGFPITISYQESSNQYLMGGTLMSRSALVSEAQSGVLLATLTAHLRSTASELAPQPLLAPIDAQCGTGTGPTGDPALPVLSGSSATLTLDGRHVAAGSPIFVDGALASGSVVNVSVPGSANCTPSAVQVTLNSLPGAGTHVLQVLSQGLLSNELPFVKQ